MAAFDKYLHAIMVRAEHETREESSTTIEAFHLLLAVAAEQEAATRQALASVGLDHRTIRAALDREFAHSLSAVGVSPAAYALPRPSGGTDHPRLGASAKLALERGFSSVGRKKDLRAAHLLLGILQAEVGTVPRALALAGVDRTALLSHTRQTVAAENE